MLVRRLPRAAATFEYRALRLPATVLQTHVVPRFFAENSGLRLAFEGALGTLDERAGTLLRDDTLTARGRALRQRSALLEKATELEETAGARAQAAEATARAGRSKAEKARAQARREQENAVQEALRKEQAQVRHAQAQTAARLASETSRIQDEAAGRQAALLDERNVEQARIDAQLRVRTAPARAQLDDAAQVKATAEAERATADRLATLADEEKRRRKAARSN